MQTMEERFWSKVKILGENDCWEWQAYKHPDGYGMFRVESTRKIKTKAMHNSHRIAYFLHTGIWPKGLTICHKCDNPPCCNPAHLFAGTQADNVKDMVNKGRANKKRNTGSINPLSKLTESDVSKIKTELAKGIPQKVIAQSYQVSSATISNIKHGKGWAHV